MVTRESDLFYLNEHAIRNYLKKTPDMFHNKKLTDLFWQITYSQWAAKEILMELENYKGALSVLHQLSDIAERMDQYACMAGTNTAMFSYAYDVALDFMDYLMGIHCDNFKYCDLV